MGLAYTEERWAVGVHAMRARRIAKGTTLPILVAGSDLTRRLMVAGMNARPALVPELEQKITAELDWFGDQLAGRQHLIGDKFGRADLTAASLLAPLARPSACPLYRNVRTPERLEQVLTRWRARRSLQWVEDIYAKYRHSTIGQADQHKLPHAFPTLV
jgi:glutathione S-transferase